MGENYLTNFPILVREKLVEKMAKSAKRAGRTLTEEIEHRLELIDKLAVLANFEWDKP